MHAFETTGTVDVWGQLALDEPLPVPPWERVRMIVLLDDRHRSTRPENISTPAKSTNTNPLDEDLEDPKTQNFWETLSDIFIEDPDEDWTQLLKNANRKSQWI